MGRVFIPDTTNDALPTVWKEAVVVSDNNNTLQPTVWKEGVVVPQNTGGQAPSNQHPGCIAPVVSFTAIPTTGNYPLTVNFTDTSTNTPSSWLWNFGDGNTSTLQNPSHIYSSAGTYAVTLTATNVCGSSVSNTPTNITVSAPPADLFLDNFSGAGESLELHTPDIAPGGFGWKHTLRSLAVNGTVFPSLGDSSADSSNSAPAFTLNISYPYNIEVNLNFEVSVDQPEGAFFRIRSAGRELVVGSLGQFGTGVLYIYTNATIIGSVSRNINGNYTVKARVIDATTVEFYADGVLISTFSGQNFLPVSPLTAVEIYCSRDPGTQTINYIKIFLG